MENRSEYILNIIIPCWNASKYLPELLDSILAQTYKNWQLIAVDDESVDNTVDILKQYSEKDTRITYKIRNRGPKGAQTCRNIGLNSITDSKYVIFMDSDDVLATYCFEQRIKYMEEHPDLDFAVFPAKVFEKKLFDDNKFLIGFNDGQDELNSFLFRILPFSVWNNIYKVKSLKDNELYWDERLLSLQDTDFAIQSLLKKLQFEYAEDSRIDYFWRVIKGSSSITSKIKSRNHAESHIYLVNKLFLKIDSNLRNQFRIGMHYLLLVLLENIKGDADIISVFFKNSWFSESAWYKFRMQIYNLLPNNNKIKHILFPSLISNYLNANRLHQNVLKSYQKSLFNFMTNE